MLISQRQSFNTTNLVYINLLGNKKPLLGKRNIFRK